MYFLSTCVPRSTNHVSSVALGMANNGEGPSKRKRALKVSLSMYTFYHCSPNNIHIIIITCTHIIYHIIERYITTSLT